MNWQLESDNVMSEKINIEIGVKKSIKLKILGQKLWSENLL